MINELHKTIMHITKHRIISEEDLMERLQQVSIRQDNMGRGTTRQESMQQDNVAHHNVDNHVMLKSLQKSCQDHYTNQVNKNINMLLNKGYAEIRGQRFDCPIKYLEHEIANPPHEYADIDRLNKAIPRTQALIQKLELQKDMEHSIGGMSM
jgi:hypothetical protein